MLKKDKKIDVESLNELISTGKKILRVSFIAIIIGVIVLGLYLLNSLNVFGIIKELLVVISPVFIGLILAWLLDPVVKILQRKKIPRLVACIFVYLVFIGLIVTLLVVMMPSFVSQIKDFVNTIPSILTDLKMLISDVVNSFSSNNGIDLGYVKKQIFSTINSLSNNLTNNLPDTLINIATSVISGGMFVILGLMIGFYMLYDFDKFSGGIINMLPKTWRSDARELTNRINHSLREYVTGVLLVMSLVFITQSIGLSIAGLKSPLVFALFCAITDVIPYFGPYIGAITAVIVGFTISPWVGIGCVISIVVVQILENNFYQPLIMGHTMKLHPVTIMAGLLIFEHFFGIIGMIVATPVIACIKVIFTFIDEKKNVMQKIKGE